ncbi:hypothetical protein OG702_16760 [Streptomyces sp. NBC_01198]|nr:hypothetical protein OG702_16760 [Streptomyces sp. NBC_01198]
MGFKSFVNKLGDGVEHGVDKVKKKAGELVDDGAHLVGDGLDHVGLDDAADWAEDKGDQIADDLGAHVAEQQLGQTDDPKELLHGESGKIQDVALHLGMLSKAFETGHTGLIPTTRPSTATTTTSRPTTTRSTTARIPAPNPSPRALSPTPALRTGRTPGRPWKPPASSATPPPDRPRPRSGRQPPWPRPGRTSPTGW